MPLRVPGQTEKPADEAAGLGYERALRTTFTMRMSRSSVP